MQCLFAIDIESDFIVVCRLVNTFRRKGIQLARLAMASTAEGFGLVVLFHAPEAEIEHIFNFVRRTNGVQHVAYYRHASSIDSSPFVLVETDMERLQAAGLAEFLARSKWVFASHGKALVEMPADAPVPLSNADLSGFQAFTCVKTTRRPAEASAGNSGGLNG